LAGDLGLATEVVLDSLLASGILGGDVHELSHRARGLTAEHVDESFIDRATDEGVDHVGVSDVGKLIALLGEALDALPEALIGPLPIVTEVLGVT
jgi:hypothetical protein